MTEEQKAAVTSEQKETRQLGVILKELLEQEDVKANIFHYYRVEKEENRLHFYINEMCYTYHNRIFKFQTAMNFIAELIFKHYGVSEDDIEKKNVEVLKHVVDTRIKFWSASTCLERFLPDGKVKVISCDEDGKYEVGIFSEGEAKFKAEGGSIAEAKHQLALSVFKDSERFQKEYVKWLLGKKRVGSSFVKKNTKYSDARWAVIKFFKQNYFNLKRPSFYKNQICKEPKENEDDEDTFYASYFIRHREQSKQDAAKECIRSIKHIITQKSFDKRNNQRGGNWNSRSNSGYRNAGHSGWGNNRGGRTNGWGQANRGNSFQGGNNFSGMQMGNMGMQMGGNNQGMMSPQQYQMYYNQMQQQSQMGNQQNSWGWGNRGNQGQKRPAQGGFNSMFNQAKQARSSGAGW